MAFAWNEQELQEAQVSFRRLCETIAAMRDPVSGCAWMIEQNHHKLARYLIEEAYEAVEVISGNDPHRIPDELGDVLLQVVLHSQIAKESGSFSIIDTIRAIDEKMRRRHPHVFATSTSAKTLSIQEVEDQYAKIKTLEKSHAGVEHHPRHQHAFSKTGSRPLPAIQKAMEIGKIAHKIRFDWQEPLEVLKQLESEVRELREAMEKNEIQKNKSHIDEEMGDVFFSWVQLARHLNSDPEILGLNSCSKFISRFDKMLKLAQDQGLKNLEGLSTEKLEELWSKVKGAATT